MTTRIYKQEKFIGRNGQTVYQVYEEATIGNQVVQLDPRNPTAEELEDSDEAFAAAQQLQIAELTSQVSTLTTERDSLQSQVDSLTTDKQSLTEQLTSAQASHEATIESLNNQFDLDLSAKDQRIAELLAEIELLRNPPFDPRVLHPNSFLDRFTTPEKVAIATASLTDPQVVLIMAELQTVSRVRLDNEKTQQGIRYLNQIEILTSERANAILANATEEEQ